MLRRIDGDQTVANIGGVLQIGTLLFDGDLLRERDLLEQDGLRGREKIDEFVERAQRRVGLAVQVFETVEDRAHARDRQDIERIVEGDARENGIVRREDVRVFVDAEILRRHVAGRSRRFGM